VPVKKRENTFIIIFFLLEHTHTQIGREAESHDSIKLSAVGGQVDTSSGSTIDRK
jgi:hypothetical protein